MLAYTKKIDLYMKKKQEWLTEFSQGELKDKYWTEKDSIEFLVNPPWWNESRAKKIWNMLIPEMRFDGMNCPFCLVGGDGGDECGTCFWAYRHGICGYRERGIRDYTIIRDYLYSYLFDDRAELNSLTDYLIKAKKEIEEM